MNSEQYGGFFFKLYLFTRKKIKCEGDPSPNYALGGFTLVCAKLDCHKYCHKYTDVLGL